MTTESGLVISTTPSSIETNKGEQLTGVSVKAKKIDEAGKVRDVFTDEKVVTGALDKLSQEQGKGLTDASGLPIGGGVFEDQNVHDARATAIKKAMEVTGGGSAKCFFNPESGALIDVVGSRRAVDAIAAGIGSKLSKNPDCPTR